ncbi:MAG: hypothetical protein Fur0032_21110 [Terrimicrobiaceae bacterium]
MKNIFVALLLPSALATTTLHAIEITAVPGPDDQGGMIMPMVSIAATSGSPTNPTAGTINVSFSPSSVPVLRPLTQWSPGDWFSETAAWRADLSPQDGTVVGMPPANAGDGDIFNNQYGFMFMSMGTMMMANLPSGNSLAIRLDALSSAELLSFNYGNAANRWDQVFNGVGAQVLWNGSMWHNYFTLPANAAPGSYSAVFEIFIATTPFTGTTGFAQYDTAALTAAKNNNFTSAFVTYNFQVIPEPATGVLLGLGVLAVFLCQRRAVRRAA